MICPNCGNEIPQGAKFCVRCGTPSPAPQAEYTAPTEYTMPAGNIGLAESGAQEEKNPKVKLLIALVVAAAVVVVSLAALLLVSHFRNGGEEPDAVEEREDDDDDNREKRRQDRDEEQEKEKEENRQEDAEVDDGGQQEVDDTPRTVELTGAQRDGLEDFVETMAWCLWDGDAASADFDTDFCYSFLGNTVGIISYDDFIRLYPEAYLANDYTLYVPEAALQKFVKDSLGVSYDEDILHQYASGEAGYWSYDGAGYYITGIDGGDFWVDEPEIEAQEESAPDDDGELVGKRILLAEDNDLNWEIAQELLSGLGLELEWAEDGQICLDKFQASPAGYYDAILMDIRMPKMNGYETTRAIRALDRTDAASVPIIAMSADAFEEDIRRCMESGMNAHVAKPIDMREVTKILRKFV